MSQTRQVVLSDGLASQIDEARGDVAFSRWMKRAAVLRMKEDLIREHYRVQGHWLVED